MTIVDNVIRCDRYGCHTESPIVGDLSPWAVRQQHAVLGWRTTGVELVFDHCPKHFRENR